MVMIANLIISAYEWAEPACARKSDLSRPKVMVIKCKMHEAGIGCGASCGNIPALRMHLFGI
jgi:hypothetical protein